MTIHLTVSEFCLLMALLCLLTAVAWGAFAPRDTGGPR